MELASDLPLGLSPNLSSVIIHGGVEAIDGVAVEWRRLCQRTGSDEPFYTPEWVRAYVVAFVPRAALTIVTLRAEGTLVAVLPLVREIATLDGLPARKLRSAGNTHTCRFDLVRDRRYGNAVVEALWEVLLGEVGWDVLELLDVPADGALMELARHAQHRGYPMHIGFSLTPPFLDLSRVGSDFSAFLNGLDAKFRSNLRRRLRKLEKRGAVQLRRIAAAEGMSAFYALERSGWKGAGHSAIVCNPATRAFYDGIAAAAAASGSLALYVLECAGTPAAMYLGIEHRKRYYLLKTAYDESLRDCSPGQLLTHDVVRDLLSRECVELDFLGGSMEWKSEWSPAERQLVNIHIFRGTGGRALHSLRFRLRPALARVLRRFRRG